MAIHTREELARLSARARREFPHAHMSDTKWRQLFVALDKAGLKDLRIVVKFIDVPEPREMAMPELHPPAPWVDTIEFGPVALRLIEWMEIPPVVRVKRSHNVPVLELEQDLAAAREVVGELRCAVVDGPDGLRIMGYSR